MIGKSDLLLLATGVLVGLGLCLPGTPNESSGAATSYGETNSSRASAPRAELEGTVILPPRQSNSRRFRGRAYRQRTNRGTPEEEGRTASQDNRYRNVIISAHPLSHDPAVEPLPKPVEIDQEEATFVPHVTPITPGTTVQFVNSDPFYHNVFSLTPGARFNIGRRPTGVVVTETIPLADGDVPGLGVVELHCDIHPQMNAFIVTLRTPYFTRASEEGTYRLEDLPTGRYRILAYMPRQEVVRFEIELSGDERLRRSIDLR